MNQVCSMISTNLLADHLTGRSDMVFGWVDQVLTLVGGLKKEGFIIARLPNIHSRGPPRQRQPREDGNEEDKENQGDETQGQQPPQRRYRRNFNYRRRRPENPKPQDGKETKAADPPAENSSAPEAEQGGAE